MRRRTLLYAGALAATTGVAGTLYELTAGPLPTEIRFWLEDLPVTGDATGDPIRFRDLTSGEKEIVRTALQAGEYTTDVGDERPPLERLRGRVERRTDDSEAPPVLVRDGSRYRVGLVWGDVILARPE